MMTVSMISTDPSSSASLRRIIAELKEFEVGIYSRVDEFRASCRRQCPGILLIDVASGISMQSLIDIMAMAPSSATVLWANQISAHFASQAVDRGVRGILSKCAPVNVHISCFKQVAAGRLWLNEHLRTRVLSTRRIRLTNRERQVAGLLAHGLSNSEIAERLQLREGTVKYYVSNLYARCGAKCRFEFALFALKNFRNQQAPGDHPEQLKLHPPDADLFPEFLNFDRSRAHMNESGSDTHLHVDDSCQYSPTL